MADQQPFSWSTELVNKDRLLEMFCEQTLAWHIPRLLSSQVRAELCPSKTPWSAFFYNRTHQVWLQLSCWTKTTQINRKLQLKVVSSRLSFSSITSQGHTSYTPCLAEGQMPQQNGGTEGQSVHVLRADRVHLPRMHQYGALRLGLARCLTASESQWCMMGWARWSVEHVGLDMQVCLIDGALCIH